MNLSRNSHTLRATIAVEAQAISEGSLKEVCCAMKRLFLALMVSAMLLIGSALPALAWHLETGDDEGRPDNPKCDWYGPFSVEVWEQLPWLQEASWWEYWCYWPHWGWEFVFWVWA